VHSFFCALNKEARKAGASAFVAKTRRLATGGEAASGAEEETAASEAEEETAAEAASETKAGAVATEAAAAADAASKAKGGADSEAKGGAAHESLARAFFRQERAALRPMAALLGGIGAQEALKVGF
jgi:hypothetical protein